MEKNEKGKGQGMPRRFGVTIDCRDPLTLAAFWREVLTTRTIPRQLDMRVGQSTTPPMAYLRLMRRPALRSSTPPELARESIYPEGNEFCLVR